MAESKTLRGTAQKTRNGFHFSQFKEGLPKKVFTELHDHRPMNLPDARFHGTGTPAVRHIRTHQYQIARPVIGDTIANQSLAATLNNQGDFILRVIGQ
jgi:hypothetical protein